MPTSLTANPRGSVWHRWDPHIHAPGTILNDQFKGDWDEYLSKIETVTPTIRALGVTDYCCIRTYREVRKRKNEGRLKDVLLLFPNVELRLGIETAKLKPINIHLIFSPDDSEHESEIERIIGQLSFTYNESQYQCTLEDLTRLGKAFDPRATSTEAALRVGATQFKVTLANLHRLFKTERWMRKNCLVAVASKSGDGTSGLQEDSSWTATRWEIESFADIIFASSPAQRAFWLGETGGHTAAWIEETYRHLKPCLHGSDAHSPETINGIDLQRYCWMKGDLTFETLRQAVIEPADRVSIGPQPPAHGGPADVVDTVTTNDAPWIKTPPVSLNRGLTAIIGARGSGKTALADIIATGAAASDAADVSGTSDAGASFLKRAAEHLGSASVTLKWGDASSTWAALDPKATRDEAPEGAKYLSQHFVERLCSAEGLAVPLRREMERVVFDNVEQTARMGTTSFDELIELHLAAIGDRRMGLLESLQHIAERIVQEDELKERLPGKRLEADAFRKQIESDKKVLTALLPKDKAAHVALLNTLETACAKASARVEALRRRRKGVADLAAETRSIEKVTEPARHAAMKQRFASAELSETNWTEFKMRFAGDVASVAEEATKQIDEAIKLATEALPSFQVAADTEPSGNWPLDFVTARRDAAKKAVGIDADRQKQYDERRKLLGERETKLQRLEAEIKHAEGSDERRKALIASRREAYKEVVETILAEESVLKDLYAPVRKQLEGATGALAKLEFSVKRDIDLETWCRVGEDLIDLRTGTDLRGRGTLKKKAEEYLLGAWKSGTAGEIAAAIERFRDEILQHVRNAVLPSVKPEQKRAWFHNVATWLSDTSHISIRYGIEYEGVSIERLSPGTRGVVLLLLYLAIDRNDTRPLIIDQPEENLDPNSVYAELVPHFRQATKRRQLIVVTHNANLVVNTDADQVIVARSERTSSTALPEISYQTGAIENKAIRHEICELLEGGERAFLDRERRYRLKWGESLALETIGLDGEMQPEV